MSQRTRIPLSTTLADLAERNGLAPRSEDEWARLWPELSMRVKHILELALRRWLIWGRAQIHQCPMTTATSVAAYVAHLQETGKTAESLNASVRAIRRFILLCPGHEPGVARVLAQVLKTADNTREKQARLPPALAPFRWDQVQRCVAAARADHVNDVRSVAILLVLYDSLAPAQDVFGRDDAGTPGVLLEAICFQDDGSATLSLMAAEGLRQAYLSRLTVTWLKRWLAHRPTGAGSLFLSHSGKSYRYNSWQDTVRALAKRATIDPTLVTPRAVRLGAALDLIAAGISLDDVRRAGGWNQLHSVVRLLHCPSRPQPMRHLADLQGRDREDAELAEA